ncbi:polynucleotide kinase [Mycobacterium phage Courthouse]|uniref:Polynucleotide kinase n=2 Tax=Omegavirus courthouse TaxID=1089119 RepID=G8I5H7_9CAUD|nr:polynucleotide kinase [Mycobacterium phage Courthouse]YP_009205255.1 polynucleotide kinase [Mycobacterium phage Ariel]AER47971.1 polynucleotide kinase [Mycobacterium phage Courthouse]AIM50002.1 polynucleotide kinase [Mycobacterium phage Ariel]ATS92963.1 polynucleotide kinase [Mycobacterium phage Superphikiman]
MATKLWAMRGFSGSGKSRRAWEIANQNDAVVVNRDMLRMQLLGEWWTGDKEDEDRVTTAEEAQVVAFLKSEISVIVDATHLNPAYLRKWARLATRLGVEFEVVDVHADVDECKRRVYQRWENEMGTPLARYLDPKVVEQQAKRFPAEKWPAVTAEPPLEIVPAPPWSHDKEWAVIYDLDGTAAIHQGRSPYDYTRVDEDAPNEALRHLLQSLRASSPSLKFIALSGRDDNCFGPTDKWLSDHSFPLDKLLMRDASRDRGALGKLPDAHVKLRLYNENIRDRYNVLAVFDDRLQVVRLWHKLGLPLYRVGDPEADF